MCYKGQRWLCCDVHSDAAAHLYEHCTNLEGICKLRHQFDGIGCAECCRKCLRGCVEVRNRDSEAVARQELGCGLPAGALALHMAGPHGALS